MVHGEAWTIKELFVYPNEYIYWSIQIVMYPFMTGLVAGAFVLSSLYHVFGVKQLKEIARFSLVFSLALLPVAMMPLLLHLQQPLRGIYVMMTPHFTSAIAAFGIVFTTYGLIVLSEIWFVYRQFIVETVLELRAKRRRNTIETAQMYSSGLFSSRLCRIHFRLGKGKCTLDDAPDAGHIHLFGGSVRSGALYSHLHYHNGDPQADTCLAAQKQSAPSIR
jgi:Polysulphide reductase, NrfD